MSDYVYQENRRRLFQQAAEKIEGPLVVFRETSDMGIKNDALIAAVQSTNDPERFFILGEMLHLPGWDPAGYEYDWEQISDSVLAWLREMGEKALQTVPVVYVEKTGAFIRPRQAPIWAYWIPENKGFSRASSAGMMQETTVLGPIEIVKMVEKWSLKAEATKKLTAARRELEARQAVFKGLEQQVREAEEEVRRLEGLS